MFSCKHCTGSDPATDTVKVSFPPAEDSHRLEQEEARRRLAEETEEEERRQREEEAARAAEAEWQRAEAEAEAERQRRAEAQRRAEEEERRRQEEVARRQQQQEAEAEAQRRAAAAAEQARQEELRQQRQAKVAAFLKAKGFANATAPKKSMLKTTYPIIIAAEAGDAEMVECLIQEGADPAQKNSSGKTATEIARKKNKKSSHDGVLRALGGA